DRGNVARDDVADVGVERALARTRLDRVHQRNAMGEQIFPLALYALGDGVAGDLGESAPKAVARMHIVKPRLERLDRSHAAEYQHSAVAVEDGGKTLYHAMKMRVQGAS